MRSKPIALLLGLLLALGIATTPVQAEGTERSPEAQIAIDHLAQKYAAADMAGVIVTDEYTSDHNGVTHVFLQQTHNDTKVAGAVANVNVQDGVVLFIGDRFLSDLASKVSGTQTLNGDQALTAAITAVGASRGAVRGTPELIYQALDNGTARLAYNVEVVEGEDHWWNLAIDAENGKVVSKDDLVNKENIAALAATTARREDAATVKTVLADTVLPPERVEDGSSYNVYPMPLESPLDGPRSVVENPADAVASPFGWHDTNGVAGPEYTITRGNNVNAYADTVGARVMFQGGATHRVGGADEADPASQPDGGAGLDFNHPIVSLDATPASYRDAAVDNLFFWNNVMHDVTYRYGFNEEAGNFQTTNYTGSGKGNDPVLAEAQDGTAGAWIAQKPEESEPDAPALNANFSTPPDGTSGRMQMYLWVDAYRAISGDARRAPSPQVRDGDLDNGVIAHEYGHGISNRLVGGPSNVGCLRNQEQQGEGWSDWWSYALTMRPGDNGATPRGIGNYVIYQDEGRAGPGIRITPYTTDMKINRSTYKTIKSSSTAAPHGVGYVWATMLWDLYWNLTDKYGFNPNPYESWQTGGNNLAIQLVVDGMKMTTCRPGFVDARNAIIAADAALTGDVANGLPGQNECLIWKTFARRGLGVSADQRDPDSKTDGIEGYDVPSHCATG